MNHYGRLLLLSVVSVSIVGCGDKPSLTCEALTQLEPTANDARVISDQLMNGVIKVNEFGERMKCWSAPGKFKLSKDWKRAPLK